MNVNWNKHRELEVFLTTYDGEQHLRLHGWLKKHDVIIKSETFQNTKTIFGTFMVYINDIMLEKLKIENEERGLYCDINVMNSEKDRWDTFQKPENLFNKIQDFLFSFQLKDKNDIQAYIEEANNTSLALFKKSKTFIDDYVETREMSYEEKLKDLDLMIESFIEEERYEDCAFLVKIKTKIEKHHAEKITKNLLKNIKK